MTDLPAGIGVGPGVVAGPVARMAAAPVVPDDLPVPADPVAEAARAAAALEGVAEELSRRAATIGGEAAGILRAQAALARDPELGRLVAERVAAGAAAAHAVAGAFAGFRLLLTAAGPYLAERAADLDDLRDRAVARLLGVPMPGIPDPGHPFVLVATDLAPADTAALDPGAVLAVVTERGGPTSHTAILARSLGLPAVVACPAAAALLDGDWVLVDGDAGTVRRDPDEATVARMTAAVERPERPAGPTVATGPGRTADGVPVQLLVNLGGSNELDEAVAADAEGVGLFRTEFLFLDRTEPPTADEQEEAYARVFAAFAGRTVVVRTLDAGADKPLRFVPVPAEPNPALGVRGVRTARRHPELLAEQLTAIAAAASRTGSDVWVMAPMVSVAAEARAFAQQAHGVGLPVAGVMVEVPAAALRASRVLAECDFASLGTNDLAQYACAADRSSGELADLVDTWQPGVLELVRLTAGAGQELGRPVGVCGEAAGDPLLALVLAGLGVTSLSMAPSSLPAVRSALAAHSLAECRDLAAAALAADDAAAARAAVRARARRS